MGLSVVWSIVLIKRSFVLVKVLVERLEVWITTTYFDTAPLCRAVD